MPVRRLAAPAVITLLAVASPLLLAACEKPAPGVSVVSGTTSAYREALCWSFDGEPLGPDTCAQDVVTQALEGEQVATLPVLSGDVVGISVDPKVADLGWYPVVGSQRLTQEPVFTTYYRFTYPDLQPVPPKGVALQVVAGQGTETLGLWVFRIVPATGAPPEPQPSESSTSESPTSDSSPSGAS
ncbi:MAG: hypothetical protein ACKO70_06240 [Actinomycetota bacterium]